jgi:hypothetical protein
VELLKFGFWNGGQRRRSAKMVAGKNKKNAFLTYMFDFLAVLLERYAEPAKIILKLK